MFYEERQLPLDPSLNKFSSVNILKFISFIINLDIKLPLYKMRKMNTKKGISFPSVWLPLSIFHVLN
jgi:hypothetical protein